MDAASDAAALPLPSPSLSAGPARPAPSASPAIAAALDAVGRASAALAAWQGCDADAGYAAVRRALAAVEPLARPSARHVAEVLYGAPRGADEGSGAVGVLDVALLAHDCAEVGRQRFQIESAITLARVEVADNQRPFDERAVQALSDAAYELGLALLGGRSSSSLAGEAARGEALGLTDAVEAATLALFPDPSPGLGLALAEVRAIRAAIEQVPSLSALADRGRLARATGAIGLAIRQAARARGLSVRAPYRGPSGAADVAVSALSLPPPRRPIDPDLAALGARLFADRRLSAGGKRACASCHDPARAFTEPRATPVSFDAATPLLRNTPTLYYGGLHATQRWDGRVVTVESQALRVVHSRAELGLDDAELVAQVRADPAYVAAFAARGAGGLEGGVTPATIASALAAYIASLAPGTAPVDAFARGDDAALSAEARRGLDVFVGRGRCARCHVPPLWGGSRPTDFAVPVYAVLGVPSAPEARALDGDAGRFEVTHRALDRGAFKTPTVRDIARTAPYMHHGRYATLEQVVDFYDRGGGRGLGLAVPNQDPEVQPLHLSPQERRALLVFMREALLDAH